MRAWSLLLVVWCVFGGVVGKATEAINGCVTFPISEEEVKLLQNISVRLDNFLDRNLITGHQRLKKVLTTFGVDQDTTLKVDPHDPLESFLLHYQIALHQDMKRMFFQMREILTGRMSSDPSHNDVYTKLSPPTVSFSKVSSVGSERSSVSPFLGKRESYSPRDFTQRPADCSELLVAGNTESGVYDIYPFRCQCSRPVKVFCDMETDGGGWIVFLSRQNTSKPVNFTRNWADYRNGFGTPGEEHWLGNEHIFALTSSRNYVLRLDANDGFGRNISGEWTSFKVESEANKYQITSTTQNSKSTAYDLLTSNENGNYFSTFDADNDQSETWKGGWWYDDCYSIHPTGIHGEENSKGISINIWSKTDSKLRYATWLQLKIRPQICSNTISVANVNTHNCNFS